MIQALPAAPTAATGLGFRLALEDDRRRDRAAVARERETRAVRVGIRAVRGELVVVDEAESRRDVEVAAPRAERLRHRDDVAVGVGDDERRRAGGVVKAGRVAVVGSWRVFVAAHGRESPRSTSGLIAFPDRSSASERAPCPFVNGSRFTGQRPGSAMRLRVDGTSSHAEIIACSVAASSAYGLGSLNCSRRLSVPTSCAPPATGGALE